MSVQAVCEDCSKTYVVGESFYGKRVKCKHCGNVFQVPNPLAAERVARPAPPAARPAAARPAAARPSPARPPAPVRRAAPPPEEDTYDVAEDVAPSHSAVAVAAPVAPSAPATFRAPSIAYARPGLTRNPTVEEYDRNAKMWLYIYAAAFGLPALLAIGGKVIPSLAFAAVILGGLVGMVMMLWGKIGILIEAGRAGMIHVLMCFFVPFYGLIFVLTHLEETKGHLGRVVGGFALVMFVVLMMPRA